MKSAKKRQPLKYHFKCCFALDLSFHIQIRAKFSQIFKVHPYMDGNGRIARFLMNAMLASGGYPWTIIHLEKRNEYMSTLEKASSESFIKPFAKFISEEMQQN